MKNYFYGFNINVRSHFNNPSEKNILFSNNYDHVRNMSGIQSVTDKQNFNLAALNPALQGSARDNANAARLESLNEITKNNPNIRLTPDAYKALASGEAVNVAVQLEAPERRNLTIGLAVALSQLAGGLAGASYSKKLGDFDIQRASGDADFVNKNGNDYKLNPFGGAEIQRGTIVVTPIPGQTVPGLPVTSSGTQAEQIKAAEEVAKVATRTAPLGTVEEAKKYRNLSVKNHEGTQIAENGTTINQNSVNSLEKQYQDEKVRVGQNGISSRGTKGNEGYVADVGGLVTEKNITRKSRTDYLTIAAAGGLISDKVDPKTGKLVTGQDQVANAIAAKDSTTLFKLFSESEHTLEARTGNKADFLIGGQHITNVQQQVNQRIKELTDSNQNINDVLTGKSGTLTQSAANRFNEANGTNISREDLEKQIRGGNTTGIDKTLDLTQKKAESIATVLTSTAGGIYATNNKVVEDTLKTLPVLKQQIEGIHSVIADRQSGEKQVAEVLDRNTSNFSAKLQSQLAAGGVTVASSDIPVIAKALLGSSADGLSDVQKKAFELVQGNTSLQSTFTSFNNYSQDVIKAKKDSSPASIEAANKSANGFVTSFNAASVRAASAASEVAAASQVTIPGAQTGAPPTGASSTPSSSSQAASTQYTERDVQSAKAYLLSNETDQNKKNAALKALSPQARELYDRVNNDPELTQNKKLLVGVLNIITSLSDQLTAALLQAADILLRKAFDKNSIDNIFDYGFSNTGQDATVGHESVAEIYNSAKATGVAIADGIKKLDKYDKARQIESFSGNKSIPELQAELRAKAATEKIQEDAAAAAKSGAVKSVVGVSG